MYDTHGQCSTCRISREHHVPIMYMYTYSGKRLDISKR